MTGKKQARWESLAAEARQRRNEELSAYTALYRAAEEARCDHVMKGLFDYYMHHPGEMPEEFVLIGYREGMERGVCDFLSGMTDRYAVRTYQQLFVPAAFPAM